MAYEKITLAIFKKKLEEGNYTSLTGARRAIGRMSDFSDEDKKKAQALTNKHFGEASPKMQPVVVTTASKKAAAKKKAEKPAPKRATKSTPKPAAKTKAEKPQAKKASKPRAPRAQKEAPIPDATRIQLANYKVGTIQQALTTMKQAKELGASEASVAHGAKTAQEALVGVVQEVMNLTNSAPMSADEQTKAELFKKAAPKGNSAGEVPSVIPSSHIPVIPQA
jgi:hypothetical protein